MRRRAQNLAPFRALLFAISVKLIDQDGHTVRQCVATPEKHDRLRMACVAEAQFGRAEVGDEAALGIARGDIERNQPWRLGVSKGGSSKRDEDPLSGYRKHEFTVTHNAA